MTAETPSLIPTRASRSRCRKRTSLWKTRSNKTLSVRSCHQVGLSRTGRSPKSAAICVHDEVVFVFTRVSTPKTWVFHWVVASTPFVLRQSCVQQAKEISTCRSCGLTGHCAGVDRCLARKGGSTGKRQSRFPRQERQVSRADDVQLRRSEVPKHRGKPTGMFAAALRSTQECKANA